MLFGEEGRDLGGFMGLLVDKVVDQEEVLSFYETVDAAVEQSVATLAEGCLGNHLGVETQNQLLGIERSFTFLPLTFSFSWSSQKPWPFFLLK